MDNPNRRTKIIAGLRAGVESLLRNNSNRLRLVSELLTQRRTPSTRAINSLFRSADGLTTLATGLYQTLIGDERVPTNRLTDEVARRLEARAETTSLNELFGGARVFSGQINSPLNVPFEEARRRAEEKTRAKVEEAKTKAKAKAEAKAQAEPTQEFKAPELVPKTQVLTDPEAAIPEVTIQDVPTPRKKKRVSQKMRQKIGAEPPLKVEVGEEAPTMLPQVGEEPPVMLPQIGEEPEPTRVFNIPVSATPSRPRFGRAPPTRGGYEPYGPPPPRRRGRDIYGPPPPPPTERKQPRAMNVDNATQIVEDATEPTALRLNERNRRDLDEALRRRLPNPELRREAMTLITGGATPSRMFNALGTLGTGLALSAIGITLPAGSVPFVEQTIEALRKRLGKKFDKYFQIQYSDQGRRIVARPAIEREMANIDLTPLTDSLGVIDQLIDAFENGDVIDSDILNLYGSMETDWFNFLGESKEEQRALDDIKQYLAGDYVTDSKEAKRDNLARLINGVINVRASIAIDEKIAPLLQGESALGLQRLLRRVAEGGYREAQPQMNEYFNQMNARINAMNASEEEKEQIRSVIRDTANRYLGADYKGQDNPQGLPIVDIEDNNLVYEVEPNRVANLINTLAANPTIQAAIDRMRDPGVGGMATAGLASGVAYEYGLLNILRNGLAGGAGYYGGRLLTEAGVDALNVGLNRLLGVQITPETRNIIGAVGGAALGAEAIRQNVKAIESTIDEEQIVPPTLEIQQQEDKKATRGGGSLRPKFIVPSTSILEPTESEKQADYDEWSAFDYVQVTSEGSEGTAMTNVLKAQHMTEEAIRYMNAGVEVHNVYGKYPLFSQQELEEHMAPKIPEMTFVDQEFDLGKFDYNIRNGYDWNGDRLAIEAVNPYRFMTEVEQNDYTAPRAMLYSVVP